MMSFTQLALQITQKKQYILLQVEKALIRTENKGAIFIHYNGKQNKYQEDRSEKRGKNQRSF